MGYRFSSNSDNSWNNRVESARDWDQFNGRDWHQDRRRNRDLERMMVQGIEDIIERDRICSKRANCCDRIHFCTECPTSWR